MEETKKKTKINLYSSGSVFTNKNFNIDSKKIDYINRRNFFKKLNEMNNKKRIYDEEFLRSKYQSRIDRRQSNAREKKQNKEKIIERELFLRSKQRDQVTKQVR